MRSVASVQQSCEFSIDLRRAKYGTSPVTVPAEENTCYSARNTKAFRLVACSTARILTLRYKGSGMSMVVFMGASVQ